MHAWLLTYIYPSSIAWRCVEPQTKYKNSKKAYQLVKDLTTEKQGKSTTIQDKSGKCLTEENEILNRWTEYCSDLYNYETDGDPIVLDCPQIPDEEHHPILREEVEAAIKALKMGKSAGVDNIPAELVQAGGEAMIDILTAICNKIWKIGEWPTTWTQSLVITLPKKGNLQLWQNYRTISLIIHPSKVMLKIILNRLKPQAEEIIAEEQAGFRAGRSTTEQIFNLRILCEKYLQHQQNLYHVFEGLWQGMARSLMGNYEEIQHQCQHHTSHWKSVWQGPECSPVQWQHRRMVQNFSRSSTMVSTLTNPL